MSTPLLKRMKQRGSTFYAFSSTRHNPNPKFSKFVLLNIPDKTDGKVLDFYKPLDDFDIYTDDIDTPSLYSEQIIESLRNYVQNQDTVFMESKISSKNDFYNIQEYKNPTERIFWKWLKKFNAIDFEPATHKVDWDKNLPDFDNPNEDTVSNEDYFRRYLWKEREIIDYDIESVENTILSDDVIIKISYIARFKEGDTVQIEGSLVPDLDGEYEIKSINFTTEGFTEITIENSLVNSGILDDDGIIRLVYHKVVQYVGEINVKSDVRTSSRSESEVIAYIPTQAGRTPSILFKIDSDTNYYPGLQLPILSEQIQPEILGAENFESPIRKYPQNYPGSYYGQFDSDNKTYETSTGDKLRYKGDYYGILLNDNTGLELEDYQERLTDFNADNLDGIGIDFNLNHYQKMSFRNEEVGLNFDEFNQMVIDDLPPEDFEYNSILWYYEDEDEDSGDVYMNLYGITILNNPDEEEGIPRYKKLVNTNDQDGLSYQHVLTLSTLVDNDIPVMKLDTLTTSNTFGFDLYTNVMSNVGKMTESFMNIIDEFTRINVEINNLKSQIYTQTSMDSIKNKLSNMEELLKVYEQNQLINSETVKIETNYDGVYPTISLNTKTLNYDKILKLTSTEIYDENTDTGYSMVIPVGNDSTLIKIVNDDVVGYENTSIIFSDDIGYKQSVDIYLASKDAQYSPKMNIYINSTFGEVSPYTEEVEVLSNIYLPTDISNIDEGNVEYNKNKYLTKSVYQNINLIDFEEQSGEQYVLLFPVSQNIFGNQDYNELVYINDFNVIDGAGDIRNFDGIYEIGNQLDTDFNQLYFRIKQDEINDDHTLLGTPQVYSFKAMNINITRISENMDDSFEDRYMIKKTII